MRTACPDCKAPLVIRSHLAYPVTKDAVFAETYECGAIRMWGLVDKGAEVPRACPVSPGRPREDSFVEQARALGVELDVAPIHPMDPRKALRRAMTMNARDWGVDRCDAWIYGIVCGWDDPSIAELADRHGWTAADVARLRSLHGWLERAQIRAQPSNDAVG